MTAEVTYSVKSFEGVVEWLEKNRRAISRVFKLPPTAKLKSSLRWVGSLLASIGFKQVRSSSQKGRYHLDTDQITYMRMWFERSQKGVEHFSRLSIGGIPKVFHSDTVRDAKTDFSQTAPLSP